MEITWCKLIIGFVILDERKSSFFSSSYSSSSFQPDHVTEKVPGAPRRRDVFVDMET